MRNICPHGVPMLYGRFTFASELSAEAVLPPFKGSTFRGAFGVALKRVVCALRRQECPDCLLNSRCVYAFFFESPPPNPFVIEPPLTTQTRFLPGEAFDFTLLLFGRAVEYLPYCVYAFDRMGQTGIGKRVNGRRAGFVLKAVGSGLGGETIYSSQDRRLQGMNFSSELTLPEPPVADIRRITIQLETPLRVKQENHLTADLPFHTLIRAALRRISSLFACYGAGEPNLDYRGMVERAQAVEIVEADLRWLDWERYSNRQETRMLMGGMSGSITYSGELREFLPVLRVCEEVHLGKQTTFGLGKIEIIEDEFQ
ncbi:MAG: CRISPR system precrRNA processing endoribonuclease RAMP protein Cas6 [Thermodesulfobacteriota bacterium]|nr:CRISPR system precrRNA processing endoribonuclease RAMP protein Cas6 [Thermodesulfobacteriota bacterium]